MEVEDALKAMGYADELRDGSEGRAVIVDGLHRVLIENPLVFWDTFNAVTKALRGDDPLYELAEKLIREGKTSFADARAALDEYAPRAQ